MGIIKSIITYKVGKFLVDNFGSKKQIDKETLETFGDTLDKWLDGNFPKNAKSWKVATGEIVTIAMDLYSDYIDYHKKVKKIEEQIHQVSQTPAEFNTKWREIIEFLIKQFVKNGEIKPILDLYSKYGIWFANKKLKEKMQEINVQLYENQQFNQQKLDEIDVKYDNKDLDFMTNPSHQFQFDCGIIFENLVQPRVPNLSISLKYHQNLAIDFDNFIELIRNELKISECELSENDIERLKIHIERYANKQ